MAGISFLADVQLICDCAQLGSMRLLIPGSELLGPCMEQAPTAEVGGICTPAQVLNRSEQTRHMSPTRSPLLRLTWLSPKSLDAEVHSPDGEAAKK